jgi:hypothetical protein
MIGLGVTGPNEVGTIGTAAGGAIAAAGTALSASGGALATELGISAAFGPIGLAVGGIVAAAAAIAGIIGVGSGCGPTCVQATNIVNQAEPVLLANLQAYQAGTISQATAISNYNQVWQSVLTACAAIPGTAGQNCVGDRQEGACHYQSNGQCWNWYVGYYLPLLQVTASTNTSTTSVTSAVSSLSTNDWMIGGALAVIGLIMVMK